MIGRTILHYTLLEKLGEGGMGVVFKAHDNTLDRDVALKFLPEHLLADGLEEARLLQEAKAAALLNHPNICGVHALGEYQGQHFIDMEYVEGGTLRQRIQQGPLPWEEAVSYALQIADALQEAHAKGIVHRDVKSTNVMVNSRNQIKVMDFGLAKLKGSVKAALSVTTVGTMAYMAPEQIQGSDADARSDIFSFGVLLFEMLTCHLPFRGDHEAAMMYSIMNEEPLALPPLRPDAPRVLGEIIDRSLQKDPARRYQSMSEISGAMSLALRAPGTAGAGSTGGGPKAAEPLRPIGAARKRAWLRPVMIAVLSAAVVLGGAFIVFMKPAARIDAIAVMPFVNAAGDPSIEYLTDGLTENLINSLSTLPGIKLMSRSSVFRFKGRDIAPEDAGKELGVGAVLAGRLSQNAGELSISVELINVRDHSHIWGERYERKPDEIQDIQRDIVQRLADQLNVNPNRDLRRAPDEGTTGNAEAYQLYLKGRFFLNKRTEEGFSRAMEFFRQAIDKDPSYALAYAGLSSTYTLQASYDLRPPNEAAGLARAAAQKALACDENSAEAHAVLGSLPGWDWAANERELRRAVELNQNYSTARQWLGELLMEMGRTDEAMVHFTKAIELDPLAPVQYTVLALACIVQHRNGDAFIQLQKSLDLEPHFPRAEQLLAHLYLASGKPDLALQAADNAIRFSDSSAQYVALRGFVLGRMGRIAEAERVVRQIQRRARVEFVPLSIVALPYIGLGRKEEAFALLNRAADEIETAMLDIKIDPMFDPLRSDPRFTGLIRKVGLTP